jgi:hypothetical protein
MNNIWVPNSNERHPAEVAAEIYDARSGNEKTVTNLAQIVNATYHQDKGWIALQVRLNDGTTRVTCLHKSSFLFNKRKFSEVSQEEVDREMNKTAELFRKRIGNKIKVQMYEDQAKLR